MQKLFLGLLALLLVAACSTPQATADKMAEKPAAVIETMKDDFRAMAPKAGPAPEIKIGDFQDFTLDNGLQVVLVENHKLPRVSYQLFVDVPPHMEGKYAGTGQMMGQMLRRATSTKTKEEIDEEIDFIGASLSAGGNGAFGATISKYKEQLMGMMAEVVLDARFPEAEFAKVKVEAETGLQSTLGNPGAIARRVRQAVVYGKDHPYGEQMTEASLKNVTLDVVKDYYNTYFVPNRSYLVMVGDLTRAEAEKLAKDAFDNWKAKEVTVPAFKMPAHPAGVTVNFVPRPGSVQSNVLISHPVDMKPGTKEAIRGSIVNRILGSGSFNSRLFQNLREDKAFTYGAGSRLTADQLAGSFTASSDVRNEVTDSAVTEFLLELTKISTAPVTAKELESAKSQFAGDFGRSMESPRSVASFALNTLRYGLDRDYYPTYLKKVEASSANDLLEVSRMAMSPKNTHIIVVGEKAVAEKLAKFATSGKVNYYDANGETVNMEDMAAPTDISPKQVIMDYTKAIGGKAAIDGVKSWSQVMEASVQGQTVVQTMYKEGGNKFSSQTQMMGMTMGDQRYNDGKISMMQQGQKMPASEEMAAGMKEQSMLFPTVALMNKLDMASISGTETINGKKAIVLDVKNEAGETAQMYFDQESKLLIRRVQKQGPTTAIVDYSDYRAVNGIMIPHEMSITGAMPFVLKFVTKTMELNADIDQSLFEIKE
jgi:predicted Zn-dependent peptidase